MSEEITLPFRFFGIRESSEGMVVVEELGEEIEWLPQRRAVIIKYSDLEIELSVDNNTALFNDMPYDLDVSARIINDRLLVPLRFITERLGLSTRWDDVAKTVYVSQDS